MKRDLLGDLARYRGLGSASVLLGGQRLIFVFVSDEKGSWTPSERARIEAEQILPAMRWLEKEARRHGLPLSLHHRFLPDGREAEKLRDVIDETDTAAGPHHSSWNNTVASRLVGHGGSLMGHWGELFQCFSHDEPGVDAGVVFLVPRYCPSVAFPCRRDGHPEFEGERAIVYDERQLYLASLVAHEVLHLFGAVDLSERKLPSCPDETRALVRERTRDDEIMVKPTHRPIEEYHVGELTAYLIGWRPLPPRWLHEPSA